MDDDFAVERHKSDLLVGIRLGVQLNLSIDGGLYSLETGDIRHPLVVAVELLALLLETESVGESQSSKVELVTVGLFELEASLHLCGDGHRTRRIHHKDQTRVILFIGCLSFSSEAWVDHVVADIFLGDLFLVELYGILVATELTFPQLFPVFEDKNCLLVGFLLLFAERYFRGLGNGGKRVEIGEWVGWLGCLSRKGDYRRLGHDGINWSRGLLRGNRFLLVEVEVEVNNVLVVRVYELTGLRETRVASSTEDGVTSEHIVIAVRECGELDGDNVRVDLTFVSTARSRGSLGMSRLCGFLLGLELSEEVRKQTLFGLFLFGVMELVAPCRLLHFVNVDLFSIAFAVCELGSKFKHICVSLVV